MSQFNKFLPSTATEHKFTIDPWAQFTRFLILGTEGGTFYVNERDHTYENVQCVARCVAENPGKVLAETLRVSKLGLAKSNDAAIYTLVQLSNYWPTAAPKALQSVCRTSTHLFHYMEMFKRLHVRGNGAAHKRAIAAWYESKTEEQVAYQLVKYRQRDGWTHRDVLRLARPAKREVYRYAIPDSEINMPAIDSIAASNMLYYADQCINAKSVTEVLSALADCARLPWECVPTQFLNEPDVWAYLLNADAVPMGALVRNMKRLANFGPQFQDILEQRLSNQEMITQSRIHPIQLLNAWKMQDKVWAKDALETAFYLSFDNVEPTNRKTLLCLDVSGSMYQAAVANSPLTAMEACVAMAMITYAVEPKVRVMGFSHEFIDIAMDIKMGGLQRTLNSLRGISFGATDCSLPFAWAVQENLDIEDFIVYTDNETNSATHPPHQVLKEYRRLCRNADVKLVVVATTASRFSVADPNDPNMLDVAGFSPDVPRVVSSFCKGWQ